MPNAPGDFIWYELLTPDPVAAAAFYAAVTGWHARPAEGSDRGYRILGTGAADVAGMLPMPGQKARWLGTIGVKDVNAAAAAILVAGDREQMLPTAISPASAASPCWRTGMRCPFMSCAAPRKHPAPPSPRCSPAILSGTS